MNLDALANLARETLTAATRTANGTPEPEPPPLTEAERADLHEAFEERAAIAEYCGNLPRPEAEAQARRLVRAYRVQVAMPGAAPKWAAMIAPGCDLHEARRAAELQFGPTRVLSFLAMNTPTTTPTEDHDR